MGRRGYVRGDRRGIARCCLLCESLKRNGTLFVVIRGVWGGEDRYRQECRNESGVWVCAREA